MSNSLAIATVTGTLVTRVVALLNDQGLTGYEVTAGHPKNDPEPGVYITLYQLSPNIALRNADLPTRRMSGEPAQRPVLPLNLRYLFSFVGDPEKFEAERLAGLVLADLHARPLLGAGEIEGFLGALPANSALKASDLARQPERVRLTPVGLDSEEMSRVWGYFNQSFYALSFVWEAACVLLDGAVEPAVALPVASTGLSVSPSGAPALTRAVELSTRQPVVASGDTLVLEGSSLLGPRTRLTVGPSTIDIAPSQLVEGALRVPVATLPGLVPGVHAVMLEHRVVVPGAAGDGERTAGVSNALAVMVRPTLGAISAPVPGGPGPHATRDVRVAVTPAPRAGQSMELTLEAADGTRRASRTYTLSGADVLFTVSDLRAGTWLVRLAIDGASSLPAMSGGQYAGPTVTVS